MRIRPNLFTTILCLVLTISCEKQTVELEPQTTTATAAVIECDEYEGLLFFYDIPTTQANYGAPFYASNGVSYRSRYSDPLSGGFNGSVVFADHVISGFTGADGCSNFAGDIMYQGWAITEIDVTGAGFTNVIISLDVNRTFSTVNPLDVNGTGVNTLPAGVTYSITPLTFGSHIELSGSVNTFVLNDHEIAIDNLCLKDGDASSTAVCSVCFSDHLLLHEGLEGLGFIAFSAFEDSAGNTYSESDFFASTIKTSAGYYGTSPISIEMNYNEIPQQLDVEIISFTHVRPLGANPIGSLSYNYINVELPGTPLLVVPTATLNTTLAAYGYSAQHFQYSSSIEGNNVAAIADSIVIQGADVSQIKLGIPLYYSELRNICVY